MKTRISSWVSVASYAALIGCENQEDARIKLGQMGYEFTVSDFATALQKKDFVAADKFLKAGMSPNTLYPVAWLDGYVPLVGYVAYERSFEGVQYLIKHGANVKYTEHIVRTPFALAAMGGDTNIVKLFLSQGIDVNERDAYGNTAIACIVHDGNLPMMSVLVRHDADIHTAHNGHPLIVWIARQWNCTQIIRFLLANGADVNARGASGETPLIAAAKEQIVANVRVLLENGADPHVKDSGEQTASHYVQGVFGYKARDIENLLEAAKRSEAVAQAAGPVAVKIEVLCGCGVDGLARKYADLLKQHGFDAINVATFERSNLPRTYIFDRQSNKMINGLRMAKTLGLSEDHVSYQASPDRMVAVTLILGHDYQTFPANPQ